MIGQFLNRAQQLVDLVRPAVNEALVFSVGFKKGYDAGFKKGHRAGELSALLDLTLCFVLGMALAWYWLVRWGTP